MTFTKIMQIIYKYLQLKYFDSWFFSNFLFFYKINHLHLIALIAIMI